MTRMETKWRLFPTDLQRSRGLTHVSCKRLGMVLMFLVFQVVAARDQRAAVAARDHQMPIGQRRLARALQNRV
jgi:hypothetical protein